MAETKRRLLSVAAVSLFLLPAILAGSASSGTLSTFAEGPSVPLEANNASSVATAVFPNPARAVNVSVNVSTVAATLTIPLPPPTAAWWSEVPGCATLERNLTPFRGTPLNASELAQLSSADGFGWSMTLVTGKPAVLLEFNVSTIVNAATRPNLRATLAMAARTDGASAPEFENLTAALFSDPLAGASGWRDFDLAPDPPNPLHTAGTMLHPPVYYAEPFPFWTYPKFEMLVVPRNDSARSLTIDYALLTVERPDAPTPASVFVNNGGMIWEFQSPQATQAPFGRTYGYTDGAATEVLLSNGTAIEDYTRPTFVPRGAIVTSAYLNLVPIPTADVRNGASGGSLFTVLGSSGTVAPSPLSVTNVPIEAHPTDGWVTLYNLSSHGVLDARQETLSTTQGVGNFSTFERSAAQTFTVVANGTLETVALNLADATGHAVGPLVVEVRNATAGLPGTVVLAVGTTNVTSARLGGWVNFTLAPALPVSPGEMYTIVLASPGAAANETWVWQGHDGVTSDPYVDGSALLSTNASGAGPWVPRTNIDMAFRVLLATPFNESEAPLLSVGGAVSPSARIANFSGNATGWRFQVAGVAVGLLPLGGGLGKWEPALFNGLANDVSFEWLVRLDYELFPRTVELAIGARAAFLVIPELSREVVVDALAEVRAALAAGDANSTALGTLPFSEFPFRVRSAGPAGIEIPGWGVDLTYDATLQITGFEAELNVALAKIAPAAPDARASLSLFAGEGRLALSDLSVTYSEPPRYFSQPMVTIPEGSLNVTVARLYQLFTDDLDPFNLTFDVVSVLPAVATAAVWTGGLDANLTLSMTASEYSGLLFVTVRATDSSGLATVSGPIGVTVLQVPDAPQVPPKLPDLVLAGTTGTFDLSPFIVDNDTLPSSLSINISSAFATRTGFNITFDYRGAPAALFDENLTIEVSDGNSTVTTTLRVLINNAGRPLLTFPPELRITQGHNTSIVLDPFVADDHDAAAAITWELLRVEGVGPTPGNGAGRLVAGRTLEVRGTTPGNLEVGVSARDTDGNIASGVLHLIVVQNQDPVFAGLDGTSWTLRQASEVRIALRDHLSDPDDTFENFSFTLAWDNGTVLSAAITNGTLVVVPASRLAGRAVVVVTAIDPAGAIASATLHVTVEGAAVAGGDAVFLGLAVFAGLAIAGVLLLSYRRGKRDRASLGKLSREAPAVEKDEEATRLASPEGLEKTDEERLTDTLDEMEKEASVDRVEVPPVTILTPEGAAAATSLLLLYRDGRPMAWATSAAPSDADRERTEELVAVLQDRLGKMKPSDHMVGEGVEMGGKKIVFEARAQLALAAEMGEGADELALRGRMREALDAIFDRNAQALKRWDGERAGLKGVDEALDGAIRTDS